MTKKIDDDLQDWDLYSDTAQTEIAAEYTDLMPITSEIIFSDGLTLDDLASNDLALNDSASDAILPGDIEQALNDMDVFNQDPFNQTPLNQNNKSLSAKVKQETQVAAYVNGKQIRFKDPHSNLAPGGVEEAAFRQQIEDLFELLELDKASRQSGSIRVYQTDSSPSRPWQFH